MRMLRGEQCRLDMGRHAVIARRESRAKKQNASIAQRSIVDCFDAAYGDISATISAVLADAGCSGLPVHVMLRDDLLRYFMVTPPSNAASMTDLRSAAEVRFEGLYGDSVASWHVMADWRSSDPFLACAAPRRLLDALRFSADSQKNALVSVTPSFVAAWNRRRREVSGDAWLATLSGATSTLGIVVGDSRPRLAAVRTLVFTDDRHSAERLCEQVAYAALLEGVPPPASVHVHGLPGEEMRSQSAPDRAAMVVHWHRGDDDVSDSTDSDPASTDKLAQREAAT